MQRKKNIFRLIILAALLVATPVVWFLINRAEPVVEPGLFRTDDLKMIDQIRLSRDGQVIQLHFDGVRWMLNDSIEADADMITVLFATFAQAVPRHPVGEHQRDSIAAQLKSEGVKVSLYQEGKEVMAFYAGGNARRTMSYFMGTSDPQPYLMTIPGYRVYVAGIFEQEVNAWRNKRIFDFNWRNFQGLAAEFRDDTNAYFTVSMSGRTYALDGDVPVDTARMNTFLDDVSLVHVERYLTDNRISTDSLQIHSPEMTIKVQDVSKAIHTLAIYQADDKTRNIVVLIDDKRPALITAEDAQRLMKRRSFFVTNDR